MQHLMSTKGRRSPSRPWLRATTLVVAVLACSSIALRAQRPNPAAASQFDITGFLQAATVDAAGDPLSGGTLTVNGHLVIVPKNTIVILPATALSWSEMFSLAPAGYAPSMTGLAQADVPAPMTTYEIHVIGNTLVDGRYVAGMVHISQQDLNSGAGYINYIDYATGEIFVGGVGPSRNGARVALNDPSGRYGRAMSPDPRFTVDIDNPTVASGTGFPMCLPRFDPAVANDPLCPQANRTIDAATGLLSGVVNMTDPRLGVAFPDPTIQVPIEIGDYVSFAGTLVHDGANPTQGPNPGVASTYISAHTIGDNIAVYTAPGANPAYVSIEVSLIGTGGLTVVGAGEAAIRTRFEGMTTDFSRPIHLYGMDFDPATGAVTDRDWGTIGVDPGPAGGLGAVQGRWRFRPPCLPFGSNPAKPDKQCVMNASGTFLPPTREVRAVIEGLQSPQNGQTVGVPPQLAANGIIYGQFHAPIDEYIFPENIPGTPVPPNNFDAIDFLSKGGYASATPGALIAGQLNPWPGDAVPPCPTCVVAPVVTASAVSANVASGGSATLLGSATGTAPITFAWTQTAGPLGGSFANPALATTTFTAPVVFNNTPITLHLQATNAAGTSGIDVNLTVNAAQAPSVSYTPAGPVTTPSGTTVTLNGVCVDPQGFACTVQWTQTNAGAVGVPTVLVPNPSNQLASGTNISFLVNVPIGATSVVIQLQAVATTPTTGLVSGPDFTNVTFTATPDNPLITAAVFRTGKQRLDITASSSIVSPLIVLTLQPYVTTTGVVYTPTSPMVLTNNGNGTYTMTLVGVPEPAVPPARPLVLRSNIGGVSPASALTLIRQ